MKSFKIFTDFDLLRTLLFAFTALDAVLRFFLIVHFRPTLLGILKVFVCEALVPYIKILGNIDSERTGLAVTAVGTAVSHLAENFCRRFFYKLLFLIGHRLVITEGLEIILNLIHLGHSAENELDIVERGAPTHRP